MFCVIEYYLLVVTLFFLLLLKLVLESGLYFKLYHRLMRGPEKLVKVKIFKIFNAFYTGTLLSR